MGWNVTLPLHGTASFSRGVPITMPTSVVRLRSHLDPPSNAPADFVLVRSKEELQKAADAHFNGVMIVSDGGLENLPEAAGCPRLISVPEKFNYLSRWRHYPIPSSIRTI